MRKSESRETTFDTDLRGLEQLLPALAAPGRRSCADDLTRHGRSGRTVGIKVRLDDFSTHTRARTLDRQVADEPTLCAVSADLLRALDPARPVRLLGVRVAGMEQRPGGAEGEPEEIPSSPSASS